MTVHLMIFLRDRLTGHIAGSGSKKRRPSGAANSSRSRLQPVDASGLVSTPGVIPHWLRLRCSIPLFSQVFFERANFRSAGRVEPGRGAFEKIGVVWGCERWE